jgi:hypothetical protein
MVASQPLFDGYKKEVKTFSTYNIFKNISDPCFGVKRFCFIHIIPTGHIRAVKGAHH